MGSWPREPKLQLCLLCSRMCVLHTQALRWVGSGADCRAGSMRLGRGCTLSLLPGCSLPGEDYDNPPLAQSVPVSGRCHIRCCIWAVQLPHSGQSEACDPHYTDDNPKVPEVQCLA